MFGLKIHEVEVYLRCKVIHALLPENNVAAEWRVIWTVGETRGPEVVEYPGTDQVRVLDHLGAGG